MPLTMRWNSSTAILRARKRCHGSIRSRRRARRALGQRTGLLDEIERAMRRFVRQLQHVIEALPRIRHVLLGEIDQARIDAEALAAPTAGRP